MGQNLRLVSCRLDRHVIFSRLHVRLFKQLPASRVRRRRMLLHQVAHVALSIGTSYEVTRARVLIIARLLAVPPRLVLAKRGNLFRPLNFFRLYLA